MPVHERLSRRKLLGLLAAGVAAPQVGRAGLDGWLPASSPLQGTFTLSGATVLSHTGQRLTGGVRVEDGIIVEVGAGVSGGEDLGGAWLVPGFVDAGCTVGLAEIPMEESTRDDNESSDAVTPDARVVDAYNALSAVVPVTRAAGILAALVHPSTSGLISGQAALMQLAGLTAGEAVLAAPAALCINLGRAGTTNGLKTRMGVAMRLREIFDEIDAPAAPSDKPQRLWRRRADEEDDDDLSAVDRIYAQVRAGEVLALIKAERVDDILAALELMKTYALRGALLGCAEGHLVAQQIADAGVPVLLGPITTQPSSFEHPHAVYENPAILHAAGVKLALRSGSNHFARGLPTSAGVAVAHGLPFAAAITALTASAGEILGVEGLSRMEEGAPASFFISDGDPLQPRSAVRQVWIGGRQASLQTRQTRLWKQYQTLEPLPAALKAPGPRP